MQKQNGCRDWRRLDDGMAMAMAMGGGGQPHCLLLLVVSLILILKVVVIGGGILVLLVLGDEVVHIALSLGELHFVHSLAGVPVEEGFAAEHGGELLGHPLEHI